MTQLKLFTLVGVANLLLEVSPELLYGVGRVADFRTTEEDKQTRYDV
jgi:hypothetical protein